MQPIDVRNSLPLNPDPRRRYEKRQLSKIDTIVLHSTGTGAPELMPLARYDVTPRPDHHISPKGCPGFTYHYYIDEDNGEDESDIFLTSSYKNITWHAGNHNANSIGVCMRYKYVDNPNPPSEKQLQAVYRLLTHLCLELKIDPDNIKGHRELQGTGYTIVNGVKKLRKPCPGMLVSMSKIRYIVSMGVQRVLAELGLYIGKIDGVFGPKSEAALAKYNTEKRG
jgi:N-acetyl-anhydromuramyl-L-alanine amidase AmpD